MLSTQALRAELSALDARFVASGYLSPADTERRLEIDLMLAPIDEGVSRALAAADKKRRGGVKDDA